MKLASATVALALAVAASIHGFDVRAGLPARQSNRGASSPHVRVIAVPDFWGANAIWGATGHDRRGHVWFGISSNDEKSASAHLYELNPVTGAIVDRGNVIDQLGRAGLRRAGERQMKIHSRIVEGPEGALYFASMDESDENPDGSRLPTWGGHLWRLRRAGLAWEHLFATREALIAVARGGAYIYALGYFDHVLFQFDTRSGRHRSVRVGAAGGHVSRNFFADDRGHVFVPRVNREAAGSLLAELAEFDTRLQEVGRFRVAEYFERGLDDSHGIVAAHPESGGSWLFATGKGRLYRIRRNETGKSHLHDLGWFHPSGSRYTAAMFQASDGTLHTVASSSSYGDRRFEWITREADGSTSVVGLPYGEAPEFPHGALLYGSMTRDRLGRFYAVGTMAYKPIVLQIDGTQRLP